METELHNKKSKSKIVFSWVIDILAFCVGGLLFGFAVNVFFTPNGMIPGGFTGLASIGNYLFGLPIGITGLLLNVPLFIWAVIDSGWKVFAKMGIATGITSIMIDVAKFIPVGSVTDDKILAAIAGGVIGGLGIGLIFMRGGCTGGTDIIAAMLNKHIRFISIGKMVFFANLIILASTFFVYNSIESPLYSTIAVFIYTKVIDVLLNGTSISRGKMILIMSSKNDDISEQILFNLHRGVTKLKSTGAYSEHEGNVLLCAVGKTQLPKALDIIHNIDSNAFIIVGDAEEINGLGFKTITKE